MTNVINTFDKMMPKALTPADIKKAEFRMFSAIKQLIKREVYFATILLTLPRHIIAEGTMATDGKTLLWSPRFVLDCTDYKLFFVLLHELLHVKFKHSIRGIGYDHSLAGAAMDYVINLLIVTLGGGDVKRQRMPRDPWYTMPVDGLFDWRFANMSWEEVYVILKWEREQQGEGEGPSEGPGEGPGESRGEGEGPSEGPGKSEGEGLGEGEGPSKSEGDGDQGDEDGGGPSQGESQPGESDEECPWGHIIMLTHDDGTPLTGEEVMAEERSVDKMLLEAELTARARGNMSVALGQIIKEEKAASQDWREILLEWLVESLPNDFSFDKPNRMHMSSDIIMPSYDREGFGHLVFLVDDSGSVSDWEFEQMTADMRTMFEELQPEKITVIHFDSRAYKPEEFDQADDFEIVRRGRGGTNFNVAFAAVKHHDLDPDAVVFFTDGGDNHYPAIEPDYPVIWATTGAFWGGNPPFGELVQVKFDRAA